MSSICFACIFLFAVIANSLADAKLNSKLAAAFGRAVVSRAKRSADSDRLDQLSPQTNTFAELIITRSKRDSGCDIAGNKYDVNDGNRICATVFDGQDCAGDGCQMAPGTFNFNALSGCSDFTNRVASLSVHPGCSLTLCLQKDLQGECKTGASGTGYASLEHGFDKYTESLKCTCN